MRILSMFVGIVSGLAGNAAWAQNPLDFEGQTYIEHQQADGESRLELADKLKSGDRVITILRWEAKRDGRYAVTAPIPNTIRLVAASDAEVEASSDGGRNWGLLDDIKGQRITHLRWVVDQKSGRLAYRAIVR